MTHAAEFRFYEELNDFLPLARRKRTFNYSFQGTPSVRDAIQAIGVPHSAVDLILVDGEPVRFSHRLRGGERVAVYPVFERLDISPVSRLRPRPLRRTRFVLDGHTARMLHQSSTATAQEHALTGFHSVGSLDIVSTMPARSSVAKASHNAPLNRLATSTGATCGLGRLARYLRMLGFDSACVRDWDDSRIIDLALEQRRIILTRDLGILKHSRVTHGYWVRSQRPTEQLREVLQAFDLSCQIKPFTRCMDCNGRIARVAKEKIGDRIDPAIISRFDSFWQCRDCGKIYWQGSHYRRMLRRVEQMTTTE